MANFSNDPLENLEMKLSLTRDDIDYIIELSRGSTLDRSPKKNWVENEGGLPQKIEDLAKELVKKGMSVSHAIATAVSKAKKYALTANGQKKLEWQAAVAEWEKKRLSSRAKTVAKKLNKD